MPVLGFVAAFLMMHATLMVNATQEVKTKQPYGVMPLKHVRALEKWRGNKGHKGQHRAEQKPRR